MTATDHFRAMIAGLEQQGMSHAQIAVRAGVSRTTIWRVANGRVVNHLTSTVERMEQISRPKKSSRVQHK